MNLENLTVNNVKNQNEREQIMSRPKPATGTPVVAPVVAPVVVPVVAPVVVPVVAPVVVPAQRVRKSRDPVKLQVLRSQQPDGKFNLFVRVLNIADQGLAQDVDCVFQGQRQSVHTDKNGSADCPFNPITAPANGTELQVLTYVSGIEDFSVMHVIKRIIKTPTQAALDAKNNKRARIFIYGAGVLLLICALIGLIWGLGNPLINPAKVSLMSRSQTLSTQQVLFNNLPGVKGSSLEVKPEPAPVVASGAWRKIWFLRIAPPVDAWQKPLFSLVALWTMFSIIYWIFSWREEVAEAFRRETGKFVDRHYNSTTAKDPLLQRLVAFTGQLKTARRPETTAPVAADAAPRETPPVTGKNTFWELFRSDLMSDFVTNVLPGVLKAVFKR